MAQSARVDAAVSADQAPIATRRWGLVLIAVLLPIVLGATATLVLYATRAKPVVTPSSSVATTDVLGLNGSVLVVQPRSTASVRVPLGVEVEIVLQPGLGEAVESENAAILAATTNPPCHFAKLCGLPGARIWTFRAIHAGLTYLKISFGVHICRVDGLCTITPLVFKPIAVYSRSQAS
jgi:hypothetical protein